MKNPMMANALVQTLIKQNALDTRSSFLAGAAWAFEELDRAHPEWALREIVPALLQRLQEPAPETSAAAPASDITGDSNE